MEQKPDHKKDQTKEASGRDRENDAHLGRQAPRPSDKTNSGDTSEFVVTEKNEDDREFVGGKRGFTADHDEISIESPGDLMGKETFSAKKRVGSPIPTSAPDSQPIGQSQPPQPSIDNQTGQKQRVKKLSPEEVKEIEKNLYGGRPYFTGRGKEGLTNKIGKPDGPNDKTPPAEPENHDPTDVPAQAKPDMPPPKMAKRGRGVAYFYRNYIQVKGSQELYAGDELHIEGRWYELKPKQFNRKALMAAGAVLLALLLIVIGTQFVSTPGTGKGEIIGVVLNKAGQPYVRGATIRLPELGKSIGSTPQGFFRSGLIPEGTHKIEYVAGDDVLKVDYATVVGGKITMISIRPDETLLAEIQSREAEPKSHQPPVRVGSEPEPPETSAPASKSIEKKTAKKIARPSARESGKKKPARITLASNVQGARLEVDGDVLGAGNLTYSKIKSGKHEYTVSKDGFQPASGTIELSPGENKTLSVELIPMSNDAKVEVFTEEDFYFSGLAALKEKNFETAIADLTEATDKRPSYAEAYLARAEAYSLTRQRKLARDDYVRAAEIFQIKKNLNQAVTAYNNAIKTDKRSVTAYLGRANVYLAKSEEIAAIADYKTVLRLDKRNARAHFGLGEARFKQGQYKKASKHLKKARSIDTQNPLIYQYLMLCYLATDDIKKVKKSFEKFKEVASDEQMNRLRTDTRFSAVLRIVEND